MPQNGKLGQDLHFWLTRKHSRTKTGTDIVAQRSAFVMPSPHYPLAEEKPPASHKSTAMWCGLK